MGETRPNRDGEKDESVASTTHRESDNSDLRLPAEVPARTHLDATIRAGRHKEARRTAEMLAEARPQDPDAWNMLGVVLRASGHPRAAVAAYSRSLEISSNRASVLSNLGNAWRDLQRFDEAITCHRAAVTQAPKMAIYWGNLGVAQRDAGRFEDALGSYDRAIALDPANSVMRFDRAQVLLMLGRYQDGWIDFEHRWKLPDVQPARLPTPRWDGAPLPRGTLLLWPEQGYGDTILSVRFVEQARARVGRIILACKPELRTLFNNVKGIDQIVLLGEPVPPHDAHAPLMNLLQIFISSSDDIPAPAKFSIMEAKRTKLQPVFYPAKHHLKVGIVWSGSVTFKNNCIRATTLERFLELGAIQGVRLFSLQKGPRAEDLGTSGAKALVTDLAPHLHDFADTAAAIEQLDLVVMTDSSVAHLAGSLGRPVWNLLPRVAYWLYGSEGEATHWYPSMRLFRQRTHGDWDDVFTRVKAVLGTQDLHRGLRPTEVPRAGDKTAGSR